MQETQTAQIGSMEQEMSSMLSKGYTYNSCYEHSFGPIGSGTTYVNGWNNVDMRNEIGQKAADGFNKLQKKALGPTTFAAGNVPILVPIYVDPRIVEISRKYTPLVEMIPRVTNQGLTADYNRLTAKGGAYTAILDAPLPEADDTYERKSVAIKFLYSVGRVLGPMQAAMPSYVMEGFQPSGAGMVGGNVFTPAGIPNAKQTEVLVKARAMKELEENLIINGDAATDATQFSGIIKFQDTTNRVNADGAALTWDMVEEAIQKAFDAGGRPKIAIASSAAVRDLRSIMINTFNFRPSDLIGGTELPFGVPPQLVIQTMVGPIPVIPSMYLDNTPGSKSIYFLDTDYVEMRVLQDMTYTEMAITNDSSKFMLKIYEALIVRAPEFNSFVANIL